ncbi:MAG: pstS2 [Nitrospirae bacterium]|nr:pstS2 [Nitrospirota bacterium]
MKVFLKIALALAVMLSFTQVQAAEKLNGAGATFPYPVYSAWAFDYSKVTGVQLNYQSIGSGGGVRQITDRTVDFGASDDPMKPEQLKKNKLLQFPAVIGGVVPVGNLEGITPGQLKLDSGTLCKIFLGEKSGQVPCRHRRQGQ